MRTEFLSFVVWSTAMLVLLSLVSAEIAVAASVLLGVAMTTAVAAVAGGWIAGRQAAKVPFSKRGLFRTGSDTRGHFWPQ